MGKFLTPFENFVFRAFNFGGRASLLEYWLVMSVIWTLILFLLWGDAVEFWGFLLARKVPPLNPLYWDGIFLFLLTIIPRLSLTVRRLHDSGKSGKWAKLPYLTFVLSIYLVLGLITALASVGGGAMSAQTEAGLATVGIFMLLVMGNLESIWDMVFAAAAVLNAMGWDAIWEALSDMTASVPTVDAGQALSRLSENARSDPSGGMGLVVAMGLIAAPFITFSLHLFFMISPGKPEDDLINAAPVSGASLRRKGEVSDNPFAGYKYLYAKSEEQEAAHKAKAKEEIKSLYQQRVLGQQQTG